MLIEIHSCWEKTCRVMQDVCSPGRARGSPSSDSGLRAQGVCVLPVRVRVKYYHLDSYRS
jgi:hypothetical protein